MIAPGGAILLYDGTCGLCARTVGFVLANEGVRRSLRFARLEGPIGRRLIGMRPDITVDSVVWHEAAHGSQPARTLVRSAAALAVLRYLGGPWSALAALLYAVPRFARDAGYDFVARHRHKLTGLACVIPGANERARFLDPDPFPVP